MNLRGVKQLEGGQQAVFGKTAQGPMFSMTTLPHFRSLRFCKGTVDEQVGSFS